MSDPKKLLLFTVVLFIIGFFSVSCSDTEEIELIQLNGRWIKVGQPEFPRVEFYELEEWRNTDRNIIGRFSWSINSPENITRTASNFFSGGGIGANIISFDGRKVEIQTPFNLITFNVAIQLTASDEHLIISNWRDNGNSIRQMNGNYRRRWGSL